ncbi:uncharacterized protein METZ01_LOCUS444249, partial [marine metagenome]
MFSKGTVGFSEKYFEPNSPFSSPLTAKNIMDLAKGLGSLEN